MWWVVGISEDRLLLGVTFPLISLQSLVLPRWFGDVPKGRLEGRVNKQKQMASRLGATGFLSSFLGRWNAHVRSVESLIQDWTVPLGCEDMGLGMLIPMEYMDPHEGDYMNSCHSSIPSDFATHCFESLLLKMIIPLSKWLTTVAFAPRLLTTPSSSQPEWDEHPQDWPFIGEWKSGTSWPE